MTLFPFYLKRCYCEVFYVTSDPCELWPMWPLTHVTSDPLCCMWPLTLHVVSDLFPMWTLTYVTSEPCDLWPLMLYVTSDPPCSKWPLSHVNSDLCDLWPMWLLTPICCMWPLTPLCFRGGHGGYVRGRHAGRRVPTPQTQLLHDQDGLRKGHTVSHVLVTS